MDDDVTITPAVLSSCVMMLLFFLLPEPYVGHVICLIMLMVVRIGTRITTTPTSNRG